MILSPKNYINHSVWCERFLSFLRCQFITHFNRLGGKLYGSEKEILSKPKFYNPVNPSECIGHSTI